MLVLARGGQRTIGVWLDSCYSGAFLLRLALAAFEDFEGFRLDEGLASCLPDETCGETAILEHGVFTYTRLHPGNSHVDQERFNRAILQNDRDEVAKGLQGLVGMTSNPSAFLTEGRQFSVSLTKHVISVEGGFATVELDEKNDFADVSRRLTNFKKALSELPWVAAGNAVSDRNIIPSFLRIRWWSVMVASLADCGRPVATAGPQRTSAAALSPTPGAFPSIDSLQTAL